MLHQKRPGTWLIPSKQTRFVRAGLLKLV